MTLGELVKIATSRPDLYGREVCFEHIPAGMPSADLLFTTLPDEPTVWIEPAA